jgi:7-carboxy-7-deazaguanine synthase
MDYNNISRFVKIKNVKKIKMNSKVYNLKCQPYDYFIANNVLVHNCDSKYAKEGKEMTTKDIIDLIDNNCQNVTITGGEPLLQPEIEDLVKELTHQGKTIHIETNGTIFRPLIIGFCTFIVSPKPDFLNPRYLDVLRKWSQHATFKFVIRDRKDFDEALRLCSLIDVKDNVYFMPEGVKEEDIKPKLLQLVEWVKEIGYGRVTPRLQIYLFGNARGT